MIKATVKFSVQMLAVVEYDPDAFERWLEENSWVFDEVEDRNGALQVFLEDEITDIDVDNAIYDGAFTPISVEA